MSKYTPEQWEAADKIAEAMLTRIRNAYSLFGAANEMDDEPMRRLRSNIAAELAEKDAEIERLRGALAAIRDWDTTPRTAGGCDYGKCAYIAIAALKGGVA